MSAGKAVLIGCGAVVLLAVLILAAAVGWVVYITSDVQGVSISVDGPLDVTVGQVFEITVSVKNERQRKVLEVSDIDIGDEYLVGFVIISTEPTARSTMHIPIDNTLSHTFDVRIDPGETKAFVFTLRAEKAGIFRGDIDVCEGARFITTTAQTVVSD